MTRTNNTLLRVAVTIALAGLLVLPSCDRGDKPQARPQVSVAIGKNVWCSLTIIAERRGFFDEEGLDVKIVIQDAGKYCMDALIADQVQFANVVEVNVAYLGFTGNRDIRVIGSVVESTSCGIVAPRNKGISQPRDLVGKQLAFSPGTGGELFAYRFLENKGIDRNSVTLRKIQPKAIPAAVVSGNVDAAATWEPFIYSIVKGLEGEAVVFRDADAYTGYMFLATKDDWARENSATVGAFLSALRKAANFAKREPQEARKLLTAELRVEGRLIDSIWAHFRVDLTFDKMKMVEATTSVGKLVKQTEDRLRDKMLPDYGAYFQERYFADLED